MKRTYIHILIVAVALVCIGALIFFRLDDKPKSENVEPDMSVQVASGESCFLYLSDTTDKEYSAIDAAYMRVAFDKESAWGSLRVEPTLSDALSGVFVTHFDNEMKTYQGDIHLSTYGDSSRQYITFSQDDRGVRIVPSPTFFGSMRPDGMPTSFHLDTVPCPILEHTTQLPNIRNMHTEGVYEEPDSELFGEEVLTEPLSITTPGIIINNGAIRTEDSRVWIGYIPPENTAFMKVYSSLAIDNAGLEYAHAPLIWDMCIDMYECVGGEYSVFIEFFDTSFKS